MSQADLERISAGILVGLLPVDNETALDVMRYASSLPGPDDAAAHLKSLLGESPDALNFVHQFCARRWPALGPPPPVAAVGAVLKAKARTVVGQQNVKTKSAASASSSRAATPAPVANGYIKKSEEDSYLVVKSKRTQTPHDADDAESDIARVTRSDRARTATTPPPSTPSFAVAATVGSSTSAALPSKPVPKPKREEGTLVSEFGRKKPVGAKKINASVSSSKSAAAAPKSIKVQTLKEVEDAINTLELEYAGKGKRRLCECQAQRHPLLQVAPNCLSCGKIICVREGLGPCTFCGHALLTTDEYDAIYAQLRQERGQLRSEIHNEQQGAAKKAVGARALYSNAAGGQPGLTLDGLDKATTQLSNLLHFQDTSAERTKIIDQASDFEMPGVASDRWTTPAERAMQIKKQLRTANQLEALERKRNGRAKHVVSIDLRGNKVVVAEHSETDYDDDDDDEPENVNIGEAARQQAGLKTTVWNPDMDNDRFIMPHYPGDVGRAPHIVEMEAGDDIASTVSTSAPSETTSGMTASHNHRPISSINALTIGVVPPALQQYNAEVELSQSRPIRVQDAVEFDPRANERSLFLPTDAMEGEFDDEEADGSVLIPGMRESKYANSNSIASTGSNSSRANSAVTAIRAAANNNGPVRHSTSSRSQQNMTNNVSDIFAQNLYGKDASSSGSTASAHAPPTSKIMGAASDAVHGSDRGSKGGLSRRTEASLSRQVPSANSSASAARPTRTYAIDEKSPSDDLDHSELTNVHKQPQQQKQKRKQKHSTDESFDDTTEDPHETGMPTTRRIPVAPAALVAATSDENDDGYSTEEDFFSSVLPKPSSRQARRQRQERVRTAFASADVTLASSSTPALSSSPSKPNKYRAIDEELSSGEDDDHVASGGIANSAAMAVNCKKDWADYRDEYNIHPPKGSSQCANPYIRPLSPELPSSDRDEEADADEVDYDYAEGEADAAAVSGGAAWRKGTTMLGSGIADDDVEIVTDEAGDIVKAPADEPYEGFVGMVDRGDSSKTIDYDVNDSAYMSAFGYSDSTPRKVRRWRRAKTAGTLEERPAVEVAEEERRRIEEHTACVNQEAAQQWLPAPDFTDEWNVPAHLDKSLL
ncbi:uncharacterized protein V1518DRAFT_422972 [Limtongia smithiae]|uniref:uncharacterized protein n=1 Tax=Limtongia smithiae TaxID=1125753 RepID=UPI0034CD304E